MWVEKLFGGVLRVLTPLGPRYIKPSLSQRIYLLWVFRHFQILPLLVLTSRQRRLIDALCQESGFISLPQANEWEAAILGTLERGPPVEVNGSRAHRSDARVSDTVSSFAADV